MFLSKSDEETTANRKLAKELVDKWVSLFSVHIHVFVYGCEGFLVSTCLIIRVDQYSTRARDLRT